MAFGCNIRPRRPVEKPLPRTPVSSPKAATPKAGRLGGLGLECSGFAWEDFFYCLALLRRPFSEILVFFLFKCFWVFEANPRKVGENLVSLLGVFSMSVYA